MTTPSKTSQPPDSYAARFRYFRERAGLSQDDVAKKMKSRAGQTLSETTKRMDLSVPSIWDIESNDTELFTCYSPRHIWCFSQVLGITPTELLILKNSESPVTAPELVKLINEECAIRNVALDQLEDAVGWHLSKCMNPPELLLEDMTLDGMKWLCRELRIDWARVIAGLN